jgi:exonuclease VII small subunit
MTDLNWYRARLQDFEDRRWTLDRVSQDIAEFEDFLRTLWDDNAARDIRIRHTLPLEEEHVAARTELKRMVDALQLMHGRLEQVQQHYLRLVELSKMIETDLFEVAHEMNRSHQERERAGHMTAQVLYQAAEVHQLILAAEDIQL